VHEEAEERRERNAVCRMVDVQCAGAILHPIVRVMHEKEES
jgi:hypothetical protein